MMHDNMLNSYHYKHHYNKLNIMTLKNIDQQHSINKNEYLKNKEH